MRPGEIPLKPEPAEASRSREINCPVCGSAWRVEAAACGNCGWRLPLEGDQASATLCPSCHQSKHVDSLTNRCTRCYPIKIDDIQPELQAYAGSGRDQRYKEFAIGMLIGPIAIAICAYYSKGGLSTPLVVALALTPMIMGGSVYSFIRKGTTLLRYYRLGFVMRYVKPIDAELQYDITRGRSSKHSYFNLCSLGPDSLWPTFADKRIPVEIPATADEQVVDSKDKLAKFFKGFDPMERPTLWAKVYFDPDQSGSAVIRIADSVFVSITDNRPPANLF